MDNGIWPIIDGGWLDEVTLVATLALLQSVGHYLTMFHTHLIDAWCSTSSAFLLGPFMTKMNTLKMTAGIVFNLQDFEQNKIKSKQRSFEDFIGTSFVLIDVDLLLIWMNNFQLCFRFHLASCSVLPVVLITSRGECTYTLNAGYQLFHVLFLFYLGSFRLMLDAVAFKMDFRSDALPCIHKIKLN